MESAVLAVLQELEKIVLDAVGKARQGLKNDPTLALPHNAANQQTLLSAFDALVVRRQKRRMDEFKVTSVRLARALQQQTEQLPQAEKTTGEAALQSTLPASSDGNPHSAEMEAATIDFADRIKDTQSLEGDAFQQIVENFVQSRLLRGKHHSHTTANAELLENLSALRQRTEKHKDCSNFLRTELLPKLESELEIVEKLVQHETDIGRTLNAGVQELVNAQSGVPLHAEEVDERQEYENGVSETRGKVSRLDSVEESEVRPTKAESRRWLLSRRPSVKKPQVVGRLAMSNLWNSRCSAVNDNEVATQRKVSSADLYEETVRKEKQLRNNWHAERKSLANNLQVLASHCTARERDAVSLLRRVVHLPDVTESDQCDQLMPPEEWSPFKDPLSYSGAHVDGRLHRAVTTDTSHPDTHVAPTDDSRVAAASSGIGRLPLPAPGRSCGSHASVGVHSARVSTTSAGGDVMKSVELDNAVPRRPRISESGGAEAAACGKIDSARRQPSRRFSKAGVGRSSLVNAVVRNRTGEGWVRL